MSKHGVLPGLWPIPGDGVLARQGDLVLLIHPAGGAFTDRLLSLLTDAARAGQSGRRFADLMAGEFDADADQADAVSGQQPPAAVAFGPAAAGTAVAMYGAAWADIATADGVQRLTPGQPYGRMLCVLPSRVISIRAGVQATSGDADTDPYLRLADGVVRADALVYAPGEIGPQDPGQAEPAVSGWSPAESAHPDAPTPRPPGGAPAPAAPGSGEPAYGPLTELDVNYAGQAAPRGQAPGGAEAGPQEISDQPEPVPLRPPTEVVRAPAEPPPAPVPGPGGPLSPGAEPLGVLVLADGSVFQLDSDYVIGREPTLDPSVTAGQARPLLISGASDLVSRVHARVDLDGWRVYISDLHSANGTEILLPGEPHATMLEPGVQTAIVAGTRIRLGRDYELRFDPNPRR
jgi:FHA domain